MAATPRPGPFEAPRRRSCESRSERMSRTKVLCAMAAASVFAATSSAVRADKVELTDGNTLTGKIVDVAGGKMKFNSDGLGDVMIDLEKVKSFTTDTTARVRIKGDGYVHGP